MKDACFLGSFSTEFSHSVIYLLNMTFFGWTWHYCISLIPLFVQSHENLWLQNPNIPKCFFTTFSYTNFLTRMYKVDSAMYLKQFVLCTCLFSLKFCCRMTILTQRKTLDKKSAMLYFYYMYTFYVVILCYSLY